MRPTKNQYFLDIALAVAKRSTCLRSAYGAIIVDSDRILSSGYNGSIRGAENCCDRGFCFRPDAKTRTEYNLCVAVHSEDNVINNIRLLDPDIDLSGTTIYISGINMKTGEPRYGEENLPCSGCAKLLKENGIETLVIPGHSGPIELRVADL